MRGTAKLHSIGTVHQGGGGEKKTDSSQRDLFTQPEEEKYGNGNDPVRTIFQTHTTPLCNAKKTKNYFCKDFRCNVNPFGTCT